MRDNLRPAKAIVTALAFSVPVWLVFWAVVFWLN